MTMKHFKKPKAHVIALIGATALFAIIAWSSRSQANSNAKTVSDEMQEKLASLNRKAQLASSGDERAVNDLADAVFAQFAAADMNDALSEVKNRLVISEVNYRREGKGGISESELVNSLNQFSKQLGAPDFARVSVAQVRYLRVNLLTAYPSLISQSSDKQLGKSGLNSEMSPLEAASLSMLLVTQKLSNEDFQVTPEEWAQKQHQKEAAKWEAHRSDRAARVRTAAKGRATLENAKSKELKKIFTDRAADMEALVDNMMTQMGISAQGRTKQ